MNKLLLPIGFCIVILLTACTNPLPSTGSGNNDLSSGSDNSTPSNASTGNDGNMNNATGSDSNSSNNQNDPSTSGENSSSPNSSLQSIDLTMPTVNQQVSSPVIVKGSAPGNWFFEASLPVELQDQQGRVIAQQNAQAKSDWQTTEQVQFEASIPYTAATNQSAYLIIRNDNPSGLPENQLEFRQPIQLQASQ